MYKKQPRNISIKLMSFWTFLMLLPIKAMAVLPNAADVAEGADTDSPLQFLQDISHVGVGIAGPIIAGVISLGIAGYLFVSFRDAREKGDWGKFGTTFILGSLVIVAVIVLALLAVEYAEPTA
ncbi:MAG: DUF2976 domain-containing protein [Candidatus Thiodiazotropha endolucinida]